MVGVGQSRLATAGGQQQIPIVQPYQVSKQAGDWCRQWDLNAANPNVILMIGKMIADNGQPDPDPRSKLHDGAPPLSPEKSASVANTDAANQ
jgi:hypothetical protein